MSPIVKELVMPTHKNKPGNNYIYLKAHKPEKNYPERLISTGCASHTKVLAAITAHELSKVKLPCIIQDTNDFLRKIKHLNESGVLEGKEVIHVSFDIVNMFPSISKEVGLEECRKHLDKRSNPLFSTECILSALEITLDNNLTDFENLTYKQCKGTAMGPKNACIYADVAMNKVDEMIHNGTWDSKYIPLLWARFRDDVYVPWTFGWTVLKTFHKWLNSLMLGISYTMSASITGTEYLNTFTYDKNGKIQTKPYSKPCDDHTYLVTSSCHPTHNLKNIPKGIFESLYKISSEPEEYTKSKLEYSEYLIERGYSKEFIQETCSAVEQRDRESYFCKSSDLSANSDLSEERFFPLVCDYNPALPNVSGILAKHKHIISLDSDLSKVIKPEKIFTSFRGARTIQDMLVHSKLPTVEDEPPTLENEVEVVSGGCQPCDKSCVLCKYYLKTTKVAYSYHTSSTYPIEEIVDCNTPDVVYIVNDLLCQRSYSGCTTVTTNVRFRNHKSHIKKSKRTCELATHFTESPILHELDKSTCAKFDNSLKEQLEVIIVEKVKIEGEGLDAQSRLKQCQVRERYWRDKLKTLKEFGGLNIREENIS